MTAAPDASLRLRRNGDRERDGGRLSARAGETSAARRCNRNKKRGSPARASRHRQGVPLPDDRAPEHQRVIVVVERLGARAL